MKVHLTRESVAAGDDADAPHPRTLEVPDGADLQAVLGAVLAARYLPSISGGLATWSASSGVPLAVLAQQWPAPRMLFLTRADLARLHRREGALRLHFNYHTQLDPELVLQVLSRLRLYPE